MNLKRSLNSALERAFGYRLVRQGDSNGRQLRPLEVFFTMLKRQNFQPQRIYDVGANHGLWARCAINYFPDAAYTLVEPQAHLKSNINDLIDRGFRIEWISAGAGCECGEQWFTIATRDDSSTFAGPPGGGAADSNQVRLEVTTLNKIASRHLGSKPELVKIDAEGWDLKVLEGASDLIGVTDIFLLEAAVCARGMENTIISVMRKLDQFGYRLIDITDINRSPKDQALWLTELVFLRQASPLLDGVVSYE